MAEKLYFYGPGTMPGGKGKNIHPGDEIPDGFLSEGRIKSLLAKVRIGTKPPRQVADENLNAAAENSQLKKEAVKMVKAIEEKDARIMELNGTVAELRSASGSGDERVQQLQGDLDRLTADLKKKSDDYDALAAEKEKTDIALKASEDKNKELASQLKAAKKK